MNQLTAYLLTEAIINSLVVGAICYIALKLIVAVFRNIPIIYKYHLSNIALLIPLFSFIKNLPELFTSNTPAPVDDIVAVASETVATLPIPAQIEPLEQPEVSATLWESINNLLQAYSNEILVCYLIGLLLFTIRLSLQYVESRKLKATATLPVSEHWQQLLNSTKQQLNVTGNIVLAFTEKNISPCIIGHAKAMILLPVSLANNLSTEQAEAILLHELAHYKQYDHYINLITQCINCILFFNPFTWLISKEAYKHRELACDDVATKRDRNIELAETLVMIANIKTAENTVALNLKKSPLFNRVQTLLKMNNDQKTSPKFLSLGILTIVLSTALVLFSNSSLFSQEKEEVTLSKTKLATISNELYNVGNKNYVIADAIKDDLLKDGDAIHLTYDREKELLNIVDVHMSDAQKTTYSAKAVRFIEMHKDSISFFSSMHSTVSFADIADTNSSFWDNRRNVIRYVQGTNMTYREYIVQDMQKGGSIAPNGPYNITFSEKGIFINGQKLNEEQSNRYKELFFKANPMFRDADNFSHTITHVPDEEEDTGKIITEAELRALSARMFDSAMQDYVIIDAIADGFLKDGEDFTVSYENGSFSIQDKVLPINIKHKYEQKMEAFKKRWEEQYNMWGEVSSTVNLKAIKNGTHSMLKIVLPKPVDSVDPPQSEHPQNGNLILQEIFKDKLARRDTVLKVVYLGNDVFLNGKFLQGEVKDKYLELFYEQYGYWDLPIMLTHTGTQKTSTATKITTYEQNSDEIISEIYKDKLASPDTFLHLLYTGDSVYVNHKSLSAQINSKYVGMFFEQYGPIEEGSNGVKITSVTTKKSNWEKASEILSDISKDNLTNNRSTLVVSYTGNNVYINYVPLDGAMKAKYLRLFETAFGELNEKQLPVQIITAQKNKDGIPMTSIEFGGGAVQEIMTEMFAQGNIHFIILKAMDDGFVKPGGNYDLSYRDDTIKISGVRLPRKTELEYSQLIYKFHKAHHVSTKAHGRMRGSVKLEDVVNANSSFRKHRIYRPDPINGGRYIKSEHLTDKAIGMMVKDGVLDTTKKYHVKYNYRGIIVNGTKLNEEQAEKYLPMFRAAHGSKPRFLSSDGISIMSNK